MFLKSNPSIIELMSPSMIISSWFLLIVIPIDRRSIQHLPRETLGLFISPTLVWFAKPVRLIHMILKHPCKGKCSHLSNRDAYLLPASVCDMKNIWSEEDICCVSARRITCWCISIWFALRLCVCVCFVYWKGKKCDLLEKSHFQSVECETEAFLFPTRGIWWRNRL